MFLENIEEYVFDEDRVVTYKWLSQTLEIHVNLAKRLLETFLKQQKKKEEATSPKLCVTYAVTGIQETKNGTQMTKIAVVSKDGLEDAKSGMKEVLGQHVFSIQKSALKDSSSLFSTDYEITKQNITQTNRFSAIQCKAAQVRSSEELDRLKQSQQNTSATEKPQMNGKSTQHELAASSKTATSSSSSSKSAPKPKKGSIAASFASQSAKSKASEPKEKVEKKQEETKKEEKKEVPKPKPKGMMAFMTQKKKETPSETGPSRDSGKSVKKEEKEDEDVDVEEEEEEQSPAEVKEGRSTHRRGQADKKKKRIDVSDSESDDERDERMVARKRRRIIQQADSSSEEEDEEEDDMDDSPIPPTPPPAAQPVQSEEEDEATPTSKHQSEDRVEPSAGTGSGRRRIRKRVLKSKMSVDEDGSMVTEKVWESESTDASEDEAPRPQKPKPAPKKEERDSDEDDDRGKKGKKGKGKKTSPPSSKGKQSSLMSFFKKK